ncbi:hypothetical protein DBR32_07655 [Taibaiella sp. KBW10]|uniref:hypothetical protein n=1 Tax=Taibaiella sp. KBW10 TaxID=2153357 RepID=UPI000F5AF999|nr:hypothetical protein [Taibaiella sp. KBW10]RQO31807.1 hypothetical protein DBR32_07655 [Taibaiella sp. KBW10]
MRVYIKYLSYASALSGAFSPELYAQISAGRVRYQSVQSTSHSAKDTVSPEAQARAKAIAAMQRDMGCVQPDTVKINAAKKAAMDYNKKP